MNLLHELSQLLGHGEDVGRAANSFQGSGGNHVRFANPTGQAPAVPMQRGQLPASQGGPDLTWNPNPNTNIPFSSHDPVHVLNMHQIFQGQQANQLGQGGGSMEFPSINQGGAFNPGFTPLQDGNLNYQQAPQPATFNPIQNSNYNPHRPGIFF